MSLTVAGPVLPPVDDRGALSRILDRVREFLGAGGPYAGLPYGNLGGDPRAGYWLADGPWDRGKPIVTEGSAMGLPAYGRGVELIASTIAGVELRAYRWNAALSIDERIEPAPEVLRDPDPIATPWAWKFGVAEDLVNYGNSFHAYGEPNAEGWPRWLVPIDAEKVELGVDKETGILFWRVGGPRGRVYPYGGLLHISAGNRSGKILGRSKLLQYADALGGVQSTDAHARRYFQAGGQPTGILKVNDPDLTPEQAATYKSRYRETVGRPGNSEPLVVPGFVDYTPVVSDAEKQQLVAARQWDSQLAAMVLGIPSTYLGLQGTSMNYTTVETVDIGFVRDTVDRWAKPFEAAMTKWTLPRGQTARFDWTGRLRTDTKTRAEVHEIEIRSGTLTENEARQQVNRPPLDPPPPPPAVTPPPTPTPVESEQDPTPEVAA